MSKKTVYKKVKQENTSNQRPSRFRPVILVWLILAGILLSIILVSVDRAVSNHMSKDFELKKIVSIFDRRANIEPILSAAEKFPELGIREDYLPINEYSRPGISLERVDKIVIHYTANPGTSAQANRDYFANLATTEQTYASSHFVIDTSGEVIQCIPLNEMAYASNSANSYCISIECCHPDESGEFSTETYNKCVALTAELCKYYKLNPEQDVIRHYDITGKECPIFYVEHPEEWEMFIGFVKDRV